MSEGSPPRDFLTDYLGYDALTRTLKHWAQEHKDFVRLSSLAKTEHGRDVWMLEIGTQPDHPRPAICIDGNMHAAELLGSNAALAVAQSLIDLHLGVPEMRDRFAPPINQAALRTLYYIIPRVSPDGAEDVLAAGRLSRSAPRKRAPHSRAAYWVRSDVDGDGRIRQMRLKHPAGEFVQHREFSHVLVPRTFRDEGPFFKVFPEGYIEGFNGHGIPFPHALSDNDTDFNRNFPFEWSSGHDGAGHFPGWEPETRALIEFATRSPHIFAWLNLHTFGGIFIRPPFSLSGQQVERRDLLVYDHVAEMMAKETGMPTVSAFEDMTPVASRPMTGTLAAWAYGERACFAWAVELWDLFTAARLTKRRPYYRNYAIQDLEEITRTRQLGSERQQWPNFCAVASIQSPPTRRSRNWRHRPGSRSDQSSGEGDSGDRPEPLCCCDHAGIVGATRCSTGDHRAHRTVGHQNQLDREQQRVPADIRHNCRSVAAMELGLANALSMLRLFPCVRPGSGRIRPSRRLGPRCRR